VSGNAFRDRIAEVIYVRDRFDGPAQDTADAILAMPEMKAIKEALMIAAWLRKDVGLVLNATDREALRDMNLSETVIDWALGDPS
jgi:hypothetical protein